MDKGKREELPKNRDGKDYMHVTVRAAVSAVPIVGGPAVELIGPFFQSSLDARKEKWLESLSEDFQALEKEVADLPQREDVITIAIHASQIALRTHQEEKLQFLRNAVKNSARELNPTEDQSLIFLNILDALTPSHVKVLSEFDGNSISFRPKEPVLPEEDEDEKEGGSMVMAPGYQRSNIFSLIDRPVTRKQRPFSLDEDMFTQVARKINVDNTEFVRQILKDLLNRGLIEEQDGRGLIFSRKETQSLAASDFGIRFLRFIRN